MGRRYRTCNGGVTGGGIIEDTRIRGSKMRKKKSYRTGTKIGRRGSGKQEAQKGSNRRMCKKKVKRSNIRWKTRETTASS